MDLEHNAAKFVFLLKIYGNKFLKKKNKNFFENFENGQNICPRFCPKIKIAKNFLKIFLK